MVEIALFVKPLSIGWVTINPSKRVEGKAMIKVRADKLGYGDRLAHGDAVVGVEVVGNMVELDIEFYSEHDGASIVVPCSEEFEVKE